MNRTALPLCLGLLLLALPACHKDDELFDADADAIVVEVLWKNDVNGTGVEMPAPKDWEVFINAGNSTTEYLLKRTTNANGRCAFEYLPDGDYIIWAAYTMPGAAPIPALIFHKSDQGNARARKLVLDPANSQTGLVLACKNAAQEPLVGLKVCVHLTSAAATAGCSASAFAEMTTDQLGRVAQWNIAPGTYYARIATAGGSLLALDTINVAAGKLTYEVATIALPAITGLELRCVDANGVGVPGLTIHGYATQALAIIGNSNLAAFDVPATGNGVYRKEGIVPQGYVLRIVNGVLGIDQTTPVTVPAGPIIQTSVLVVPNAPTGLRLSFVDPDGGPLPQVLVRGYTSSALAAIGDSTYAVFDASSDGNGVYQRLDLPPQAYHLRLHYAPFGVDSILPVITVVQGGVYQQMVTLQP